MKRIEQGGGNKVRVDLPKCPKDLPPTNRERIAVVKSMLRVAQINLKELIKDEMLDRDIAFKSDVILDRIEVMIKIVKGFKVK